MKKSVVAVLVVAVMLALCFSTVAFADASYYFDSYGSTIKSEGTKVTVGFDVGATGRMTTLGVEKIEIQKRVGNGWEPYTTLKSSNNSNFLASNTYSHASQASFTGVSGTQYQAVISFYAKNSTGSEIKTHTSSTVTCK